MRLEIYVKWVQIVIFLESQIPRFHTGWKQQGFFIYLKSGSAFSFLLIAILISEVSFYLVQSYSVFKFQVVKQPNK